MFAGIDELPKINCTAESTLMQKRDKRRMKFGGTYSTRNDWRQRDPRRVGGTLLLTIWIGRRIKRLAIKQGNISVHAKLNDYKIGISFLTLTL